MSAIEYELDVPEGHVTFHGWPNGNGNGRDVSISFLLSQFEGPDWDHFKTVEWNPPAEGKRAVLVAVRGLLQARRELAGTAVARALP